MRIETKKISEMNRAPYNPRIDLEPGDEEYESIKYSIDNYGLVQPIVWNERTNNIVAGHQRLTVLENEGEEEVQVTVVDLDDISEKQLNIALNRVRGRWDEEKLYDLLEELGDEAKNTGFTEEELEALHRPLQFFDDEGSEKAEKKDGPTDEETFPIAVTFNEADGKTVENYITQNGDAKIVEAIINTVTGLA